MQRQYVRGRKKCEEHNISADSLAKHCLTGELVAYNEDRQPILTPHECKSKFKSSSNTTFILYNQGIQGIIAINKRAKLDFNIILEPNINENKNVYYSQILLISLL